MSATAGIRESRASDRYLGLFSQFNASAPGNDLAWLRKLREDAFVRFSEAGFPSTRDEDWRFTNLAPLVRTDFQRASESQRLPDAARIAALEIPKAACQLVFINGRFAPELSRKENVPAGIRVRSLASQIGHNPEALEPHLGGYLDTGRDPFAALNTAFLEDGAYIHIRKGAVIEAPISLLYISLGDGAPVMSHPRNLIVAEESSQATIVEDYVSLDGAIAFCNAATELAVGDGAVVSHYRLERESAAAFHISTLRVQQGAAANVSSHSILLGGALVRNNVNPVLAGDGAECLINGLFIGAGHQHLDNYMLVEHRRPHCGSRQFYNGILDDQAHGVFHGRIIVRREAQKTDAKQTNRNLLLSDGAQIDTKPQLEIFADDVKCTHGATIGQIEENALFYLRSRGLDEAVARRLLLLAFASECVDRMHEGSARSFVAEIIQNRVFGMAQRSPSESPAGLSAAGRRNLGEAL